MYVHVPLICILYICTLTFNLHVLYLFLYRRNILGQYCSCLDYTKLYEDSFALINEALSQVERESEYVQFIRDNAKYDRNENILDISTVGHFELKFN